MGGLDFFFFLFFFFPTIFKRWQTQNTFASKSMHITALQLHLHYISGNGHEWLASAMTHYSFLEGLGISARDKKKKCSISYCFFWDIDTPQAVLLEETAGNWKRKVRPTSPRKWAYFCSNLTHARKMTIIKRTKNDNIYPAHSNRRQAASNHTGQ